MGKHPCVNCVYYPCCGNSTRTEPCKGRSTKMNVCRVTKHGVGEVSSKYGYDRDGKQFKADMKAHEERNAFLWDKFIEFMKENDVTPSELRTMFTRYYEEFL